jgi:pSer/pThr/pTyr-binding forkhead associated (FHA) protein
MLRSLTVQSVPGASLDLGASTAVLGRAGPKADVALPDHPLLRGLISRQHALLELQEGSSSMIVTDTSLNGTWAMAPGEKLQRLQPGVPTPVAAGSTM